MPALVLRGGRLGTSGRAVDLRIEAGVVTALSPAGLGVAGPSTEVIGLDGRAVVPGLWDHHVHVDQWSLTSQWVDLAGARGPEEVVALVRRRLERGGPAPGLPLVGYGYRDSLWTDPPHRSRLDEIFTEVALVMASGDLHQAWLNSAALRRYGLPDDGDGVVREDAWYPVMTDIRTVATDVLDGWVARAMATAASRGVVGLVDFESGDNLTAWSRRCATTAPQVRVRAAVWPDRLEAAIARGLRTGDPVPARRGC